MSPTLHVTADNKICHDDLMLKKHDQDLCCGDCTNCVDNQSPNAYMVKIRDIKNTDPVDCASCEDEGAYSLNGDFVLPVYTPSKCNFIYETFISSCYLMFPRQIFLNIVPVFSDNQITVYISVGYPSEQVAFRKSYGTVTQPDCIVAGLDITNAGSSLIQCNGEEATCNITAL